MFFLQMEEEKILKKDAFSKATNNFTRFKAAGRNIGFVGHFVNKTKICF